MHRTSLALATVLLAAACEQRAREPTPIHVDTSTTGGEATSPAAPLVVGSDACTTDADCVPNDCCHATACVAGPAPACGDAICTADCRAGTTDCGGGCLCHEGHCAARLFVPPPLGQPLGD